MALGPMPSGLPGGGLPPGLGSPGGPPGGVGGPSGPLGGPPANLGPVTIPQNNPGNVMQGVEKLRVALKMMEEALPSIPMGMPLHQKLMKIATDLSKELSDHAEQQGMQRQTLIQALRGLGNQNQMATLGKMTPPPPNQPPAMMPPGGGGGAPSPPG